MTMQQCHIMCTGEHLSKNCTNDTLNDENIISKESQSKEWKHSLRIGFQDYVFYDKQKKLPSQCHK